MVVGQRWRWVGNTRGEMAPLFQVPDVPAKETLAPNWNVAPTNDVWAVLERTPRDEEDSGNVRRELRPLRWGLSHRGRPTGVFTRSVGVRLTIVGTAHLQARDLDHGLELGNRSVDILVRVQSSRAKDYVREFNTALASWRREPTVREFVHRTRRELGVAA
ncbi:hypothetical protein [Streptomyces sp. Midd1]|uniref:hypothetical protein n=1 Tax=Streptomyces sp. Midd3 TaxID=3161191 RepID=UPI0034DB5CEF